MRHLQTFRYVKAIVEAGSIRGAAENLAISPSALNRNIQALEYDLGITVFDRLSRGVALSLEGELFYQFALEQISGFEQLTSHIDGVKGLQTGSVAIGVSEDLNTEFLCPLIMEFKNEFPNISISIKQIQQNDLEEQLVSGHLDLALFYQPQLNRHIKISYSKQVDVSLVVPNGAQLGKENLVRLYELEGLSLVTPLPHTELMIKLESACERQNMILPTYLSCTDSTPHLLRTNISLIGVSIFPAEGHNLGIPLGYKQAKLSQNDVGTGYVNIVVEQKRHLKLAASKFHERLTAFLDDA